MGAHRHLVRSMKTKCRLAAGLLMTIMTGATAQAQEDTYEQESAPMTVQLRSNGLYDLALCPNVGVEIQTNCGLAWQLDYMGAWWNNDAKHRYYSNYAFQTELRYYLAGSKTSAPSVGHHIGLYGQMATYDFEFGGTGYQSRRLDYSFGAGASYGYSFPISPRWCLDLTLGLGYFQSRYDVYEPSETGYRRTATRRLTFWGPTKLEAAFVWNINARNDK